MVDTALIEDAIRRGVREAVSNHARLGRSVPAWQDGNVVWLVPGEILVEDSNAPSSTV
jgi:hypothetical protein